MNVLIVGATGNLGSHLVKHLSTGPNRLRLFLHERPLPYEIETSPDISVAYGDLDNPASLQAPTKDIDCIIYLAGVLFRPRPETFLHRTNTVYVQNIVDAALANGVRKFILVSFPHVEGTTTPDRPAQGALDANPTSIHAQTRLAAERYLFSACQEKTMKPLVLRAGVIYGRGVKLTEAARKLMKWRLLPVWSEPTWVHLLALPDFLRIVEIGCERDDLSGIYNLCDDQPMTLQEFLDAIAKHWRYSRPWRLPPFCFSLAAILCETCATIFRTQVPLTRDIMQMAMTSVVADTTRMKKEILATLRYPTLKEGLALL